MADTPHASPAKPNVKDFFKRHDRTLTVLGAAVIFTGFVVNQHFLEKWKDASQAATTAEDMFHERVAIHEIAQNVAKISRKVDSLTDHTTPRGYDAAQGRAEIFYMNGLLDDIQESLDLVPNSADSKKMEELTARFKKTSDDYWDHGPGAAGLPRPREGQPEQQAILQKEMSAYEAVFTLSDAIRKFDDSILIHVREKRTAAKVSLQSWGRVSVGLYFIGWCLGLVGKLYKIDGLGAE